MPKSPKLFEVGSFSWDNKKEPSGRKIGQEVMDGALQQLKLFAPSLCLLWATKDYQPHFADIVGGAWDSLMRYYEGFYECDDPVNTHGWLCPLVGCSASAAITGRSIASQGVVVTVLASRYLRARAEAVPLPGPAFWKEYLPYESGADESFANLPETVVEEHWRALTDSLGRLREGATSGHGFLLCLLPGFLPATEDKTSPPEYYDSYLLRVIRRMVGYDTPIWGGSAGDSDRESGHGYSDVQTFLFCNGSVYPQERLVLAWVETKLKVGISICSDYASLTRPTLRPTRFAQPGRGPQDDLPCGKVVVEFNGKPASKVFIGDSVVLEEERFPTQNTLLEYREVLSGEMTTAYPYSVREEGVYFSHHLEKEVPLRLVKVDPGELRATAGAAIDRATARAGLRSGTPWLGLVCSCRGRLRRFPEAKDPEFIFARAEEDVAGLAGWYGFGEIGVTRRGTATQRNWAISVLALADELDSRAIDRAKARALGAFRDLMEQTQEAVLPGGAFERACIQRDDRIRWDRLAEKIADVSKAVECSIFFHDDSDEERRFVLAGTNAWDRLIWDHPRKLDEVPPWMLYYRGGEGYTGWVGEAGRILNLQRDDEERLREATRREGWPRGPKMVHKDYIPDASMAYLAAPILSGGRTIGVIRLSSVRKEHLREKAFFTVQDEEFLKVCASFIATLRKGMLSFDLGPLLEFLVRAREEVAHRLGNEFEDLVREASQLPEDSKIRSSFERIVTTIQGATKLIRALKKAPAQGEPVQLAELTREVCTERGAWMSDHGITLLALQGDPTDEYTVSGHKELLRLALVELIENTKHAGEGTRVQLRLDRDHADGRVHLAIHNDGTSCRPDSGNVPLGVGVLFCQYVACQHRAWFCYENPLTYSQKTLGPIGMAAHYVFPRLLRSYGHSGTAGEKEAEHGMVACAGGDRLKGREEV